MGNEYVFILNLFHCEWPAGSLSEAGGNSATLPLGGRGRQPREETTNYFWAGDLICGNSKCLMINNFSPAGTLVGRGDSCAAPCRRTRSRCRTADPSGKPQATKCKNFFFKKIMSKFIFLPHPGLGTRLDICKSRLFFDRIWGGNKIVPHLLFCVLIIFRPQISYCSLRARILTLPPEFSSADIYSAGYVENETNMLKKTFHSRENTLSS